MDSKTAIETIEALRDGTLSVQDAPEALWTWLADHVEFVLTAYGLVTRIHAE